MTSADLFLVNAERAELDRPLPSREPEPPPEEGYWLGSAGGEVARWRRRALAAEAALVRLRFDMGAAEAGNR